MTPVRFAVDARETVLRAAVAEAARRGDPYLGTEHLLLGLLADPNGVAVRALGVDVDEGRAALDRLDGEALGSIGIDPGLTVPGTGAPRRSRPPFTDGLRQALRRAVDGTTGGGERRITDRHLLLGIVSGEPPDAAALLLRALGCDPAAIRESLRSMGQRRD